MTHHKHENTAQPSAAKKPHFPTPPWEKNTHPKAPESDATVPVSPEETDEQANPAECEEPVVADTPEEAAAAENAAEPEAAPEPEAAASAEEEPSPAPEEEKKSAEKNAGNGISYTDVGAAFLKVQAENTKLKAELERAKDAYARAVADFDNYRRRTNEEKPKTANYAKGELAKDIFPVLDNFRLGIEAAEKQHPEAKSITEGFAMIAAQLKNALASHNVVEINPVGRPFDPNEHESLTSQPSADVPEDHVIFVHRVGYKIGDRLLRPASVVISAGPAA